MGRNSVATVVPATFQLAVNPSAASAKPSTWLPESPMKTAAERFGRKLKGRKPAHAPAIASESASTASLWWTVTASIAKKRAAMPASVAARPSMLSSRLKAFVIPTSQTSATVPASRSFEISPEIVRPSAITRPAAASWAPSLGIGPRELRSSSRPATKRIEHPPRIANSSRLSGDAPVARAAPQPATIPMKMPIPPSIGVVLRCQRSSRGGAPSRVAKGVRSKSQMAAAAAGRATIAASAFTRRKGNGCLLERYLESSGASAVHLRRTCERTPHVLVSAPQAAPWPCDALSRLGRADDDGIRRSRPLPRAVREPLPPGRTGEVPRLGARRRLDPGEPRPSHGRLPARLLGALEDAIRERGPLRPLPAGRALGVDLLRDLRPVRVALDARQREPDPQDALPAPARAAIRRRDEPDQLRRDARRAARLELGAAPARARDRVARDPDRRRLRRAHGRPRAADRLAGRPLPRHRVPRSRAAAAALLLDARSVSALRSADLPTPVGRRPDPLGESAVTADRGAARRALLREPAHGGRHDLHGRRRARCARARRLGLHGRRRSDCGRSVMQRSNRR